jgi:hypothetical protein
VVIKETEDGREEYVHHKNGEEGDHCKEVEIERLKISLKSGDLS